MRTKFLKKIICISLAGAVLLSVGCSRSKSYNRARIADVVAYAEVDQTDVTAGEDSYFGFTAELIKQTYGGNTVVAPLSTYSAIGMAANGAAGQTLEELEGAIGSTDTVNAYCLAARQKINGASGETKASVASSVWIRDEFSKYVLPEYLDGVSRYYGPEVFSLPFDKSAMNRINNWAYNNTFGMIRKAIDGFGRDAEVELISASAVKGKWLTEVKKTTPGTFFAANGSDVRAEYFSGKSALFASKNANAVRRYMKGGFYLTAVMPNGDIGEYVNALSAEEIHSLFYNEDPRGATYKMPEFKIEQNVSLVQSLKNMGVEIAFHNQMADFKAMTDHPDGLYISDVTQNAKIEVNKNGLEAAATIKIELGLKGTAAGPGLDPLYIEFNKPFVYFVCFENIPIFAGVVDAV